ncbi:Na+:solute symporter [soil metagenome]
MQEIDWLVLILFFVLMIIIGFWSYGKVKDSQDFFVAGGKLPWWLSGISHHISGYSGAVFVAYAGIAYTHGFTIYIWWALTISVSIFVGSGFLAPRWSRLRSHLHIQSPTEYLKTRYNLPTQQLIAWSGVLLKLFDVGAKWLAISLLLNGFTGTSILFGILLSGGISLIYITVGGLWADVYTDMAQFVVQIVAGMTMFFIVLERLGGLDSVFGIWEQLPEGHGQPFNAPYTAGFAFTFLLINFLSYNGGTWNLATRYISSPSGSDARKAAIFSALLYLVWPLILFFPMWAAPLILPNLTEPTQSYAILTQELLPPGLIGLVLASMFANTMSMTSSDANTVSSVISRDILPNLSGKFRGLEKKKSLYLARLSTFVFTGLTLVVAIHAENFGGILGLIISWFAALLGPVSVPMLLGLLPAFSHADSKAAIVSIILGFAGFIIFRYFISSTQVVQIASPVVITFLVYLSMQIINRNKKVEPEVSNLLNLLKID